MGYVFNIYPYYVHTGEIAVKTQDFRLAFLGANSTLLTATTDNGGTPARDILTLAGATDLDEHVGTNYTSGGNSLDNTVIRVDMANDRTELDFDNEVFTSLGGSTGHYEVTKGLVLAWKGSTAASYPVAVVDGSDFPFGVNGSNITITIDAEGLIHATSS